MIAHSWNRAAIVVCASLLFFPLTAHPQAASQATSKPAQSASPLVTTGREIVDELIAGEYSKVEARYSSQMAAALPPGKLKAAWEGLISQVGDFQSITETRIDDAGGQKIVTVVCKFEKTELDARVAFDAEGKLAGLFFRPHQEPPPPWVAPSYANPSSFTEIPLELVNGPYQLPGTLTIPKGDGPFSAIVLVQGSGPHDQDETIGPNKPFKDLAWGLAGRGIAVYRYTKRTAKYGTQISDDPASLTVDDEVIRDAQAAVALVAKQPKIDPKRVFLLGHSLGAYLAPRIANGDAQIAGLILLSAPSEPIEQLALEQTKYIATLSGIPTQQAQEQIKLAQESVNQIESPELKQGDTVNFLGANSPASYWLDLRGYHPEKVAASLSIPMLILQGERDYQVPAADFNAWKAALSAKKNATLETFPDLNHMFVAGTGPASPREYGKPGHVDESVIAAISSWMSTFSGKPAASPASASK
jgi:uncharacterized protein